MKFQNPFAEVFVPDRLTPDNALARTTHLGIGAHQDDLEFMALHGILECYGKKNRGFTGVIVTDGRGSSRTGTYAKCTDDEMMRIRAKEQKKAAKLGKYSALIALNYPSASIKTPKPKNLINDLMMIVEQTKPKYIYTHNLADKHDTHIAVVVPVIQALRKLPTQFHPKALYGCEVWRALDWMLDQEKIIFDVSEREKLSTALMQVFDSQISGGKRYDLATLGRKRANATYLESHSADKSTLAEFAMDLTPLIKNASLDIAEYVCGFIQRFSKDVKSKISKIS
jgi:LmbE family N-acetylglucosaminyl deacetylase